MPASSCARVESLMKPGKLAAAETAVAIDKQKTSSHN